MSSHSEGVTLDIEHIKLEVDQSEIYEDETGDYSVAWHAGISDHGELNTPIKKEYDSEEYNGKADYNIFKSNTVGNLSIDIKKEKLDDPNLFVYLDHYSHDDPFDIRRNAIDIEEHPLFKIKDEPISDSEAPRDGSTSQADMTACEEQNKSTENLDIKPSTLIPSEVNTPTDDSHTDKPLIGKNTCEICLKTFDNKCYVKIHMRVHTGERPYKCNLCEKMFKMKSGLDNHMQVHTNVEKPHECDVCKKSFVTKSVLNQHMVTHTEIADRPFECSTCNKKFLRNKHLVEHMRVHTGERPYECEICKKPFVHKSNLEEHIRTHTGERPYECDICKKGFVSKTTLSRHMRAHSGERPYECDKCKKNYKEKYHLYKHLRTHTDERPFECNVCHKSFKLNCHLYKHMQSHTGERPYECDICNMKFIRKEHRDAHRKRHSPKSSDNSNE